MFIHDKKQALTSIMAKRGAKGGEHTMSPTSMKPEISMDEGGEVDPRHPAAQDLIAAFHERSPEKVMGAMSNYMDIHNSMPQKDTDDDGESSD